MPVSTLQPGYFPQPKFDHPRKLRRLARPIAIAACVFAALLVVNWLLVGYRTAPASQTDPDTVLIPTSEGAMQVRISGNPQGSTLVLVHGLMGSHHWFDRISPLLEPSHRLVAIDLLGCGGSAKPGKGTYSVENQASALAEVLERLNLKGVTAVGHSLGGAVVTSLAEQSPDLVERLVIIDSPTSSQTADLGLAAKLSRQPILGPALKTLVNVAGTNSLEAKGFAPGFDIGSGFEYANQPIRDMQRMTYTAFNESQKVYREYTNVIPLNRRLAATGKPLLVIFGELDQIIYRLDEDLDLYGEIPGARVERLANIGHSPQIEAPDQTANFLLSFNSTSVPLDRRGEDVGLR